MANDAIQREITVDVIERKQDLLFVTGFALTDIALQDTFTQLLQYGTSKKSRKRIATINLRVETIIVDGEPTDAVEAQHAVMLALLGDATALENAALQLKWRRKSGRLLRNTDTALTLAII